MTAAARKQGSYWTDNLLLLLFLVMVDGAKRWYGRSPEFILFATAQTNHSLLQIFTLGSLGRSREKTTCLSAAMLPTKINSTHHQFMLDKKLLSPFSEQMIKIIQEQNKTIFCRPVLLTPAPLNPHRLPSLISSPLIRQICMNSFWLSHNIIITRKTMKYLLVVWALLLLLQRAWAWNKLCSVYCTNNNCNSPNSNACSTCATPFSMNAGLCEVGLTSGYSLVDSTPDTNPPGTITGSLSPGSGNCNTGSSGQWSYSFHGNLSSGTTPSISFDVAPASVPHFKLRVIFWVMLIDNWQNVGSLQYHIFGSLNNNATIISVSRSGSRVNQEKICGSGGDNQDYIRYDRTFDHNDTTNNIQFSIWTNNTINSKWGVKEFIVLAQTCHAFCQECWGASNTQCYLCADTYKLSNTTCNTTCSPGYGQTLLGDICVLCDSRCSVCFETFNNCSACKATGANASFLLLANSSCLQSCPVGMYGNSTDRTCYPCNDECTSCRTLPSYCFACNQTLQPYGWYNYGCYFPCPPTTTLLNVTNCTRCSALCTSCSGSTTNCQSCTLTGANKAYLLNSTCYSFCPNGTYGVTQVTGNITENLCLGCDNACRLCTGNPTPCSACNTNFWLFNSSCGGTCPDLYFADNSTWTCLLCEVYCVGLTMQMYYFDSLRDKLIVDMTFTEDMDWATFPYQTFQTFSIDSNMYTLNMFTFNYQILNSRAYRITMEPKGFIFLYNATISCKTMSFNGTYHRSINGRPFKLTNYDIPRETVWYLIKAPDMSDAEKSIINGMSNMSDAISTYTTLPYVQQLKKSGLFMFLFAGAQITSTAVLVNNIPSQNLYEGSRFWGQFVFFDVPNWEQNSNKTKYAVVPPVSEVVKNSRMLQHVRNLFDISSVEWRYSRTGHTSFFIFDVYPCLILLVVCWLILLVGYCLNKHKPLLFKKHMGKFFTLLHKAHQVSILYIMSSTILEFLYFDSSSLQRWISFGLAILVNLYMLGYELFIYYDMIKYPAAVIGSDKYEYYAIRYGTFLKNCRYEEYDLKAPWSPKHWFRPYNYHILSYYKKLLMIVSLPLFYDTIHAQAGVLIALQTLEIVRFVVTWPFLKTWRNIYRLVLECALQLLFISVLIQGFLVQQIMLNNEDTIQYTIQMYYRFGWVGFGMTFFFNLGFIVLAIYDLFWGCKKTNRELMDEARRTFYYNKLRNYQEENENMPLGIVNKWVKLGNLNNRNYDELPDINIRIQYFLVSRINRGAYEIEMKKLMDLFMSVEFNFSSENNVASTRKINKKFTLTPALSKKFYNVVDNLYVRYSKYDIQSICVKTFQLVEQSMLKPGDRIPLDKNKIEQRVELEFHSGMKKTEKMATPLEGFPLCAEDLKVILSQ